MPTTRKTVKVKLGIKFMKLEKSLIGWEVWNAKLTETQLFRELSFEIENSLIQLRSSLIQLKSSLIQLESSFIQLESSFIQLESSFIQLESPCIQLESSL